MYTTKDYISLITNEHADKPKFVATVELAVGFQTHLKNLLSSMRGEAFDLDDAVGKQLDSIGEWVGVSRRVNTPISGVYFALDVAGLGFDEGTWKGPFDPDDGISVLGDETYKLLLRAKIGSNRWNGSMEASKPILESIFNVDGVSNTSAFITDNQDMTMTLNIAGTPPSVLIQALIVGGYISLKPSTVRISYVLVPSAPGGPLFGFDISSNLVSGFDIGVWGTSI